MLSDLAWLPIAPPDFKAQVVRLAADIASQHDGVGERLIRLATNRLDGSQLTKLGRIASCAAGNLGPLGRVRLGLVGDGTLSLLGPVLKGTALRHGVLLDIVEGSYGSAVQEAMDPASPLNMGQLDMALLVLDRRLAGLEHAAVTGETPAARVDAAFQRIRLIVEALRPALKGPMLVQTLPAPPEPLFGSFDRVSEASVFSMVDALNRRLVDWARQGVIVLVDVSRLADVVGLEHWDDSRHWLASKLSFSPHFIPVYADVVARTIGAIKGKAKKALVLDLDNTLWGGVIGDDGVEGIKLGQGSATGEAFLAIQRMALELRARGVVLAVCSKNEDDAARLPFREHVEMLLREDHIAVFQANWTDKATNLRAIAETLNIGVDALVFLDDNPAERAQVRRELPLVGVPELPDDPALYPRTLAAAGYFESVAFSDEDRARADLYQSNAARAELMATASDMESYLASLDMVCTIGPIDARNRPRASQLINKSNQYNLTTRRYAEVELERAEADSARYLSQLRLADRFGDHGLISVLIADKRGVEWEIDTWLMSCRVLGRRIQEAALAHLVAAARDEGAERIIGLYIPSAKNRMVEDHYEKLGFAREGDLAEGGTRWVLAIEAYSPPELPMRIDAVAAAQVSIA